MNWPIKWNQFTNAITVCVCVAGIYIMARCWFKTKPIYDYSCDYSPCPSKVYGIIHDPQNKMKN